MSIASLHENGCLGPLLLARLSLGLDGGCNVSVCDRCSRISSTYDRNSEADVQVGALMLFCFENGGGVDPTFCTRASSRRRTYGDIKSWPRIFPWPKKALAFERECDRNVFTIDTVENTEWYINSIDTLRFIRNTRALRAND